MSKCLNEYPPFRVYQKENLSNAVVVGGEYLPVNPGNKTRVKECVNQLTYDDNSVTIHDWHRDKDAVVVSMTNLTASTQ